MSYRAQHRTHTTQPQPEILTPWVNAPAKGGTHPAAQVLLPVSFWDLVRVGTSGQTAEMSI